MTRKNFFLLGLAVVIGASVWLLYAYRGIQTTQTAIVEQVVQIQQRRPASVPVVVSAAPNNKVLDATKARLRSETVNLQQQLKPQTTRSSMPPRPVCAAKPSICNNNSPKKIASWNSSAKPWKTCKPDSVTTHRRPLRIAMPTNCAKAICSFKIS
ncbi:hypothetical protein EZJ49_01450 [Bdellovibrio bacteriovorus]|uniref:hypothetical protein n=1 Tax=Bdellovibrio bacteriovorus TaxID=959 RepID=UPI0021CE8642|nr:hypothetical protein [Bdellovibrio bacteriovorus]UXR64915.1 hypothetical protein EZJ49_01450 [Bdellovibrio bacteriovorus]